MICYSVLKAVQKFYYTLMEFTVTRVSLITHSYNNTRISYPIHQPIYVKSFTTVSSCRLMLM